MPSSRPGDVRLGLVRPPGPPDSGALSSGGATQSCGAPGTGGTPPSGAGGSGSPAEGGAFTGGAPSSGGALSTGGIGSFRTPVQIVADMGIGWNLGNTLDSLGVKDETGWGNPRTTKAMIDAVKNAGFKSLRLPTSWDDHTSGANHTIETACLGRVGEVANYGLNNAMYVIVNVHHNNGWQNPTAANESAAKDRLTKLWAQIATHFRSTGIT